MKRTAYLLLLAGAPLHAAEEALPVITVESTTLSDVSGEEVKSADLAEALTKRVPEISLVRRSGIANDIILRGQKKDNINILIDGAKVYGACPNRMDPPTSHILTNNIEGITITEGPYDVENFGTLSGEVAITTMAPAKEFAGELGVNVGSWGYRKLYGTVSGGSEAVRFLVSASNESSGQYLDGDGNDFYGQIAKFDPASTSQYKDIYKGLDAYKKRTVMGKVYADISDRQKLKLSYTANRSDDVLYPSSGMDALYDDSDIFTFDYSIGQLGTYSRALDLQYYDSKVDHPMSTFYRLASGATDSANEMISALTTHAQGVKLKNTLDLGASSQLTVGLDASKRNWNGSYIKKGMMSTITGRKSIDDADTSNRAIFAEWETRKGASSVKAGLRYDDTKISTAGTLGQPDNNYTGVSANVFANYQIDEGTRLFGGIGRGNRVPDARELYFMSAMGMPQPELGTPDLKQTSNNEIDLGVEKRYQSFNIKARAFHSWLKDYIYYNAGKTTNAFENIDATIYGLSLSGAWFASDEVSLDFGLAWLRGQKDKALAGQSDTDLAEISPLKANIGLNYDYAPRSSARLEVVAADKWRNFDSDNGEQPISGYAVFNLKVVHAFNRHIELTVGVDNLFDKTYAVSNTYKDLTLLAAGGNIMLLNEPGRYAYLNAAYKF